MPKYRKIFRGSYGTDYYISITPPPRLAIRAPGSTRLTEMRDEDLSRALLALRSAPLADLLTEAGDAETQKG